MRMAALILATTLISGSAALADTVVIKEGPVGSSTVVRERVPGAVIERREVESTGAVKCETKSVTRTNELGDVTRKTKTECDDD